MTIKFLLSNVVTGKRTHKRVYPSNIPSWKIYIFLFTDLSRVPSEAPTAVVVAPTPAPTTVCSTPAEGETVLIFETLDSGSSIVLAEHGPITMVLMCTEEVCRRLL